MSVFTQLYESSTEVSLELNNKLVSIKNFCNSFYFSFSSSNQLDYTNHKNYYLSLYHNIYNNEFYDKEINNNDEENNYYFNDTREEIQLEIIKHQIELVNFIKFPTELVNKIKNQYNYFRYMIFYYYEINKYNIHSPIIKKINDLKYKQLCEKLSEELVSKLNNTEFDEYYDKHIEYKLQINEYEIERQYKNKYSNLIKEQINNFINYISIDKLDDLHFYVQNFIVNYNYYIVKLIKNPSIEFQINILKNYPKYFEYIQNITCEDEILKLDNTELIKIFKKHIYNIKFFHNINSYVKTNIVNYIHEEYCEKDNHNMFDFSIIPNPDTNLQLIIFRFNYHNVRYINNQTNEFKKIAYKENPNVLKYLDNLTEKTKLQIVESDPQSFKFLKNPSDSVIKRAIEKYPFNIEFVNNSSEELQMLAVTINLLSFFKIINPTENVKNKFKELDFYKFKYNYCSCSCNKQYILHKENINKLTKDEQINAINLNPNIFQLIDNPHKEVIKFAVERYPYNIKYDETYNKNLQLYAVNHDPRIFYDIKNKSFEEVENTIKHLNINDIYIFYESNYNCYNKDIYNEDDKNNDNDYDDVNNNSDDSNDSDNSDYFIDSDDSINGDNSDVSDNNDDGVNNIDNI